jgi:hypothetical protein
VMRRVRSRNLMYEVIDRVGPQRHKNVCVYIHTHTHISLTALRLYTNYRCYQMVAEWTDRFTVFFLYVGEYVTLDRTFYSFILATGRIRDIGQNVLQSSFGNLANT